MTNWMNEKVVVENNVTPHDPVAMVRGIADSIEGFWGYVAARSFIEKGPIPKDDHTMKIAHDDAMCLRAVADMMEANRG
jgi:hypothetical protein